MTAIGGTIHSLRWLERPDDDDYRLLAGLATAWTTEALPDERPISPAEVKVELEHLPVFRRVSTVLAVEDGEAIGMAQLFVDEQRKESATLQLFVLPEHRRRGVGTALLNTVRARADAAGRRRLRAMSLVGHDGGARFASRAGGQPGLVQEHNRCWMAQLDAAQLRVWVQRAAERARGYSLVAFDGACPDEHLEAFAAVIPVMNTAPRADATEVHDPTPEEVRAEMTAFIEKGNEAWTVCAREDATGRFVGYTEIGLPVHRPWLARQGDTGVHPDHRNLGIGRWLKAHTALRLLAERPEVEHIDTFNAGVNAPMLSINRAMGFRTLARWREWDIPVR